MVSMNRRSFLMASAAGLALAAMGADEYARAAADAIVWGTNEAYGREKFIQPFTDKTGIEVNTELFSDPAEVVTKLAAGGAGVHILLDGSYHVEISREEGVLKPLNPKNVPNLEHALPGLRDADGLIFDGQRYGVPVIWGTDSVVYRYDMIGHEISDIGALFDKQYAGRIAMPGSLFESLIVGALYLGIEQPFSMGRKELDEVVRLLIKQKPIVRTYWKQIGDLKNLMGTGEVMIAWGWQPVMEIREQGIDVRWAHPKQGELAWYDGCYLTIEADGGSQESCERFLNYLLGPTYGALVGEDVGYRTASTLAIENMAESTRKDLNLHQAEKFLANAAWWLSPGDPDAYQDAWDRVVNA